MTLRLAPLTAALLLSLLALNIWLATAATQSHDLGDQELTTTPRWSPNISRTALEVPSPKAVSGHDDVLARPVFFKSRQPYVPPPPAPPPAPKVQPSAPAAPLDPGLVLAGVMIDGAVKKAFVVNKADSQGAWLAEGESVGGWKVLTIDAGAARLQQAGRTIALHLYPTSP